MTEEVKKPHAYTMDLPQANKTQENIDFRYVQLMFVGPLLFNTDTHHHNSKVSTKNIKTQNITP